MFSNPQFDKAFRDWRKSRPEYAALTKAIRDGKPQEELTSLADVAGMTSSEVGELVHLCRRAKQLSAEARKGESLEKENDSLTTQITALDEQAATAKTQLERDRFELELGRLVDQRQGLQYQLNASRAAMSVCGAAKAAGVA